MIIDKGSLIFDSLIEKRSIANDVLKTEIMEIKKSGRKIRTTS